MSLRRVASAVIASSAAIRRVRCASTSASWWCWRSGSSRTWIRWLAPCASSSAKVESTIAGSSGGKARQRGARHRAVGRLDERQHRIVRRPRRHHELAIAGRLAIGREPRLVEGAIEGDLGALAAGHRLQRVLVDHHQHPRPHAAVAEHADVPAGRFEGGGALVEIGPAVGAVLQQLPLLVAAGVADEGADGGLGAIDDGAAERRGDDGGAGADAHHLREDGGAGRGRHVLEHVDAADQIELPGREGQGVAAGAQIAGQPAPGEVDGERRRFGQELGDRPARPGPEVEMVAADVEDARRRRSHRPRDGGRDRVALVLIEGRVDGLLRWRPRSLRPRLRRPRHDASRPASARRQAASSSMTPSRSAVPPSTTTNGISRSR